MSTTTAPGATPDRDRALPVRGLRPRALLAVAAAMMMLLVCAVSARADFGIASFDGQVVNRQGTTTVAASQAGSHPDEASTAIIFNSHLGPFADGLPPALDLPDAMTRDLTVSLPPGLVGNPTAVDQCTMGQLLNTSGGSNDCPIGSQVGIADVSIGIGNYHQPVFNMVPRDGVPATFAFTVLGVPVILDAALRSSGDYGVDVRVRKISQTLPVSATAVALWGAPAASVNDANRGACALFGGTCPSTAPLAPFVRNPTACTASGVGLETTLVATSWDGGTDSASFVSHDVAPNESLPLGPTGCDKLSFDPELTVQPTTTGADAPTGLNVKLAIPQPSSVGGLDAADLKRVQVTLPDGMTINPGAADGLNACADADLGLHSDAAVSCPDASKIGTATATSPLLKESVTGGVYLRPQNSDDPASGEMFRIALVLENAKRGISVRLPGSITADPGSGRLVATFDNNPQLPVSTIDLQFKSGARAPLVTPPTCGSKTIDAELTSWSGKTVNRQSTFTIDCAAGLGGFAPSFKAGTSTPVAGAFSPFAVNITKPDGDADINGLSMVLPTGLLAHLKGNLGMQVGTVKAFAGPGSNPFMLPGKVFLEGQYGDAPFSLRVVVPAKAGPFDLGDVVVRQKIYVDPIDAHVTVVSDPIPTIVKGVPARLQRLDVSVDKAGFIVNPTSCAAKTIGGTLSSAAGQSVPITTRFQVGDCAALDLAPKLALSLSGKGQTKDGGHPAISATLTQPAAGANLKKVRVALPSALALDPDNSNSDGLCSFVEGSKPNPVCPASSVVGKATAVSPILNEPLSGPVYFVKNERKDPKSGRSIKTTPKLVIPLVGENGVKLTLTGTSSVPDNVHLVTTFDNIPDAAVSSFKLDITGGKKGILVVSGTDICKSTQIAEQQVDGQNGKAADAKITMSTPCPLAVVASSHTASALKLTVGGIGAGKVSVSGKGLTKTTRTITSATTATLAPKLTKANRSRLAHGHDVKVKVTVSFTPKGTKKTKTTHKTITIHGAKAKR